MPEFKLSRRVTPGVFSSQPVVVKDATFYKDRSWNNPSLASDKISSFYHSRNKQLDAKTAKMPSAVAKNEEENIKMLKIRELSCGTNLLNRMIERQALQEKSSQMFRPSTFEAMKKRIGKEESDLIGFGNSEIRTSIRKSKMVAWGKFKTDLMDHTPRNIWNRFSELSMKNVKMLLNSSIIQNDEKSFKRLLKSVDQSYQQSQLEQQYKLYLHARVQGKPIPSFSPLVSSKYSFSSVLHHDETGLRGNLINDVNRSKHDGRTDIPIVKFVMQNSKLARTLAKAKLGDSNPVQSSSKSSEKDLPVFLSSKAEEYRETFSKIDEFEEGTNANNKYQTGSRRFPRAEWPVLKEQVRLLNPEGRVSFSPTSSQK